MSKESYIGGDYIETTGGDNLSFAKGNIINSSEAQFLQNGTEGVLYGMNRPAPVIEVSEIKCAAHFRPLKNWKGEYGFDWYREGHPERDNNVNYDNLLGKYYENSERTILNTNINDWTDHFNNTPDILKNSNEYQKFNYSLGEDFSGATITKTYYTPWIALFPETERIDPYETSLNLFIENIDGNLPDKIYFDIPSEMRLTITPSEIKAPSLKQTIRITCNDRFAQDNIILVKAVKKKKDGTEENKIIGQLKVVAPSKEITKNLVVVRVKTGFLSKGSVRNSVLNKFEKLTKQALIRLNIVTEIQNERNKSEDIQLDVRKSENNYNELDFNDLFKINGKLKKTSGLDTFLINQLEMYYPGRFTDYFKLFLIGEEFIVNSYTKKDSEGNDQEIKHLKKAYTKIGADWGIFFAGIEEETLTHELFHAFGLYHSFGNDSSYTFKALETDNIMDYSNWEKDKNGNDRKSLERIQTWHWQWEIINSNLRE